MQLLGQWTQEGPKQGLRTHIASNILADDNSVYLKEFFNDGTVKFILLCFQGKMGNKPDETWIMNRLIKQLTDMGFPVRSAHTDTQSSKRSYFSSRCCFPPKNTNVPFV